jgi:PIN domain nuclease of toxin-antitoxin system
LAFCQDSDNELILSVASLWEMQIKSQLGKLKLSMPLPRLVESQQQANALQLLPVQASHVYELSSLPLLHKDPFDRVLVAQARVENLPIVTRDSIIRNYPVQVEW